MFNKRTFTIIKRELRTHLLSKSFIFMTLLVPIFLFGILGIQSFLMNLDDDKGATIIIASGSDEITGGLKNITMNKEFVKTGNLKITYQVVDSSSLSAFVDQHKTEILNESLSGIVYIPSAAAKTKEISFYSKNPKNRSLLDKLQPNINEVLLNNYFKDKQVTDEDIKFATSGVDFKELKVSETGGIKEEGYGNMILSFLFTFLLYFSLLLFGAAMMNTVLEEKNNRIVEVLLSSVNSTELLTGKILGTSITGLLQMAIWLIPVFILISTTIFTLPAEFIFSISASQLLYFLFNYFIALVTFAGIYAGIGSIFTTAQDTQSGQWPVIMLIMIPFFIAISMQSNPNNEVARIASMLPFASLIVMPARISIMDVPMWQFILAIIVNISTMLLIFPLAGKVFRVGILSTGKKPSWGEVVKWLKYN